MVTTHTTKLAKRMGCSAIRACLAARSVKLPGGHQQTQKTQKLQRRIYIKNRGCLKTSFDDLTDLGLNRS